MAIKKSQGVSSRAKEQKTNNHDKADFADTSKPKRVQTNIGSLKHTRQIYNYRIINNIICIYSKSRLQMKSGLTA